MVTGDLARFRLTGSDLTGSDLTGSDLTGSDLTGSALTGSALTGSIPIKVATLVGAGLGVVIWKGALSSYRLASNENVSLYRFITI